MQVRDYSVPQHQTFEPENANSVHHSSFCNRFRSQPETDRDLREHPLPPTTHSYELEDRFKRSVSSF